MRYKFLFRLARFITGLRYRVTATGIENIPAGGALICANHQLNWDPVFLATNLPKDEPPAFMAKRSLFKVKFIGNFLRSLGAFPVERGASDLQAIKTGIAALKDDKKLILFPEGTRYRKPDQAIKTGCAMLAYMADVPVIPAGINIKKGFPSKVEIHYGQPMFPPQTEYKHSTKYRAFTDMIWTEIKKLREE